MQRSSGVRPRLEGRSRRSSMRAVPGRRAASTGPGFRWRLRLAVAGGVIALTVVSAVVPQLNDWIAPRAKYRADFSDPIYDVSVDHDSLHKAGSILSRSGGTYFVYVPAEMPMLLGNIRAAI